ncbi:hypothetical protein J8273_1475 [Carpediemonas membranifera]|uniref:Uncharacterized protein n=1 Tax=Carpediemonas membranifera TaxID=201153 RepID=A0A8J6BFP1_9EUKA|nr:hypothetical protein J8273_1475 [Carpediemonas membranifera]|eukprot:KAG9396492.1 hypothetical protein J8273_1475 [Carpediemonas membranifera]
MTMSCCLTKIPADLKDIDWKQEGSSFLDRDITISANGVSKSVQLYMTDQRTLYGGTAGKGIASRAEIPAKSIIGLYCGRLIDFQPDDPTYCTRVGTTKFAMDASSLMGKLGVHTVNDNSAVCNMPLPQLFSTTMSVLFCAMFVWRMQSCLSLYMKQALTFVRLSSSRSPTKMTIGLTPLLAGLSLSLTSRHC